MSNPFDPSNWGGWGGWASFGYLSPPRPDSPGVGNARHALGALQRKLEEVERSHDLAGLQYAFDNFRNALKAAFPSGGPNGPVG
jgi:hypothetical protein